MILVDTNIIIYHLSNIATATAFLVKNRGNLAISTVVVAEVLSFATDEQTLTLTQQFLENNFVWLDASREVMLKSAEIRRQKKVKLPDAIIGATALCYDLTLASRNEKDFKHLPIKLINPIDQ